MEKIAIHVKDQPSSEKVQRKLFNMGYKWWGGANRVKQSEEKYLIMNKITKEITRANDKEYCIAEGYPILSVDEFFRKEVVKPETITVGGYELELISGGLSLYQTNTPSYLSWQELEDILKLKPEDEEMQNVIMQCEGCDKDILRGDRMQAVTDGKAAVDGFMQDDDAWLSVICSECVETERLAVEEKARKTIPSSLHEYAKTSFTIDDVHLHRNQHGLPKWDDEKAENWLKSKEHRLSKLGWGAQNDALDRMMLE